MPCTPFDDHRCECSENLIAFICLSGGERSCPVRHVCAECFARHVHTKLPVICKAMAGRRKRGSNQQVYGRMLAPPKKHHNLVNKKIFPCTHCHGPTLPENAPTTIPDNPGRRVERRREVRRIAIVRCDEDEEGPTEEPKMTKHALRKKEEHEAFMKRWEAERRAKQIEEERRAAEGAVAFEEWRTQNKPRAKKKIVIRRPETPPETPPASPPASPLAEAYPELPTRQSDSAQLERERAQLDRTRAELARARAQLNHENTKISEARAQLDQERAEVLHAQKKLHKERTDLETEMKVLWKEQSNFEADKLALQEERRSLQSSIHAQRERLRAAMEEGQRQLKTERETLERDVERAKGLHAWSGLGYQLCASTLQEAVLNGRVAEKVLLGQDAWRAYPRTQCV
jgi:hypothetical protein